MCVSHGKKRGDASPAIAFRVLTSESSNPNAFSGLCLSSSIRACSKRFAVYRSRFGCGPTTLPKTNPLPTPPLPIPHALRHDAVLFRIDKSAFHGRRFRSFFFFLFLFFIPIARDFFSFLVCVARDKPEWLRRLDRATQQFPPQLQNARPQQTTPLEARLLFATSRYNCERFAGYDSMMLST